MCSPAAIAQAVARCAGPGLTMIILINTILVCLYLLIVRSIRRNDVNLNLIFLFMFFCFLAFDILIDELRGWPGSRS